jgi:hypothetical protein
MSSDWCTTGTFFLALAGRFVRCFGNCAWSTPRLVRDLQAITDVPLPGARLRTHCPQEM